MTCWGAFERAAGLAVLLVMLVVQDVGAQARAQHSGTVVDSEPGRPVTQALVRTVSSSLTVETLPDGTFALPGVLPLWSEGTFMTLMDDVTNPVAQR